jgi:pantoate--beta-alanine ligase
MTILFKISDLTKSIKNIKAKNEKIALIPTMGMIHDGHLSLVKEARKYTKNIIVTIFVNEKQFNNSWDFKSYPRNLELDVKKLSALKVKYIFCPDSQEIYPKAPLINIDFGSLTNCLCAKDRLGHFSGVSLIIAKFFNIIDPDYAFFGEKDYQQLLIIKNLTQDLNYSVKIISVPTVRCQDGLAMSSRNLLLDDKFRKIAPKAYEILSIMRDVIITLDDKQDLCNIINEAKSNILESGFDKIDYLEIRNQSNLEQVDIYDKNLKLRIFFAGYLNMTRIIDNIAI